MFAQMFAQSVNVFDYYYDPFMKTDKPQNLIELFVVSSKF